MTTGTRAILSLTEYVVRSFPRAAIPDHEGRLLWRNYRSQVSVEPPSWKTEDQWQLTSQGWVGYIPLTPELGVLLEPKVELGNLFRMLEYAYRLESFEFLDGLVECASLEEFYERLANVLAKRVLDRARRGLYRDYVSETEQLPYVRGRIDVRQAIRAPWDVRLRCHYEDHTADIEENQILAWTLSRIAHSGTCTERVLPTVRSAFRSLRGFASLQPWKAKHCVGRLYNRLNEDYHPMHALCRFFLEHSGPTHQMGDRAVLPFLVNMERLYELFVAEWLKAHLPGNLMLKVQERVDIGEADVLTFNIDLVLYDADTGESRCVLDTKYKAADRPGPADVTQVVAYAKMKGCNDAVLIYPQSLSRPLAALVGDVQVRSMAFSLEGDLEEAGQTFMRSLLESTKHLDEARVMDTSPDAG